MEIRMRDRLIELMQDWGTANTDSFPFESVADHLLKNNVIALSCKVGDKVYENYNNHIFEYVITSIEILSPYDIVYKVHPTGTRFIRFLSFDKYDIGKTIFLTREEAEKALERSRE